MPRTTRPGVGGFASVLETPATVWGVWYGGAEGGWLGGEGRGGPLKPSLLFRGHLEQLPRM